MSESRQDSECIAFRSFEALVHASLVHIVRSSCTRARTTCVVETLQRVRPDSRMSSLEMLGDSGNTMPHQFVLCGFHIPELALQASTRQKQSSDCGDLWLLEVVRCVTNGYVSELEREILQRVNPGSIYILKAVRCAMRG